MPWRDLATGERRALLLHFTPIEHRKFCPERGRDVLPAAITRRLEPRTMEGNAVVGVRRQTRELAKLLVGETLRRPALGLRELLLQSEKSRPKIRGERGPLNAVGGGARG